MISNKIRPYQVHVHLFYREKKNTWIHINIFIYIYIYSYQFNAANLENDLRAKYVVFDIMTKLTSYLINRQLKM